MTERAVLQPEADRPTAAGGAMVVGTDGSSGSMVALRWALERIDRFGPIRLVTVWRYPLLAYAMPIPPPAAQYRQLAVHAIEDAMYLIGDEPVLAPLICRADAGPTLVDAGTGENLIVVGTRGRSGMRSAVLGSVSSYVVANATTPVAVVPTGSAAADRFGRVVVGLDGSVSSMRALAWAVKHTPAASTIEAVHCWSYPASTMPELAFIPRNVYEDQARFVLGEAVDAVRKAVGTRGHRIVERVEHGDPRSRLKDRAQSADLLIVGARGRGGVAQLLLGSVASALVQRPTLTTVVIPAASAPDGFDRSVSRL